MTSSEITQVKKLIKDIKNKLNEIERTLDKTPGKKYAFPTNTQPPPPRKRIVYRNLDNNQGNS